MFCAKAQFEFIWSTFNHFLFVIYYTHFLFSVKMSQDTPVLHYLVALDKCRVGVEG